nr:hypothetical protein [Tanacetum cinerariifolium]
LPRKSLRKLVLVRRVMLISIVNHKGKLSPRFIGPFEILDRVGEVSYRLALPPQLSQVHNVFHVSLSGQAIGTIISAWLSLPTTTVGMLASSVPLLRCCMVGNAVLRFIRIRLAFAVIFTKPLGVDNDKATAETKVESMVSVTIQQDMSSIPSMTSPIIDLTSRPESPKVYQQLKATTTETTTTTTTTSLPPPYQKQQSTTDAMMMKRIDIPHQVSKAVNEVFTDAVEWAMQSPLRNHFRDLPEADRKEILHQRMWETDSYKSHKDHMQLYEALEKSMNRDHSKELAKDLAKARKKKKKSRESQKTRPGSPPHQPLPPPPPAGPSGASGSFRASGSSQVPSPPPPPPSTNQEGQSKGSTTPSSSKTAALAAYQVWTTTDIRLRPSISLTPADLPMDEDMAPDEQAHVDDYILRHNVSKPLPLGGPPGHVTIQSDLFFNKDLEYLRYGSKDSRPALSISKIKAAYYPDVGLEQMVPDQIWIEEESKCDIAAMYGISHWWFQRQRFYIDRHTSEGDCNAVRTHMRILSVVIIEVFSMYGYDYMKKIVLRRADLNEHVIAERDFKYMYSSDFEDMYLLKLQGYLNHLPPKYKKILTTAVNQWTRHLVIRQRLEDFQAVTFQDRYGVHMIMRFNEIHKFSDGTLQQIDEALDYRVKEFKINRMNPGLNTRFWTRKDVDRSKEFMFSIQKRLETRRIFRNLESFVGGRVRDGDYRLLKRTE